MPKKKSTAALRALAKRRRETRAYYEIRHRQKLRKLLRERKELEERWTSADDLERARIVAQLAVLVRQMRWLRARIPKPVSTTRSS